MKKICKTCHKEFETERHDKKYCTYTCCNQYNRIKRVKETFKLTPEELLIYYRSKEEDDIQ